MDLEVLIFGRGAKGGRLFPRGDDIDQVLGEGVLEGGNVLAEAEVRACCVRSGSCITTLHDVRQA